MVELYIFIALLLGIIGYTILIAQFLFCICDRINGYFERKAKSCKHIS